MPLGALWEALDSPGALGFLFWTSLGPPQVPLGAAWPFAVVAELWEDPRGPTDAMAPPAQPLASAVVKLRGRADASEAEKGQDETGEMEVVLSGRAGLGRDYHVSFRYMASIW